MSKSYTPNWMQCLGCEEWLQVGNYVPRICACGRVKVEYGHAYVSLHKKGSFKL